jgi:ankyrin repeat protein
MVGTFLDDKKDLLYLSLVCHSTHAIFIERLLWKLECEEDSPLHWAVEYRRLNIARYFLDHRKADINAEYMGLTPLMLAAKLRYSNAVDMLLSYKSVNIEYRNCLGENVFWIAVSQGNVSIVERFMKMEHIDINGQDYLRNQAPIAVAICYRQLYILQLLLSDVRADVNVRDASGRTPLHLAVEDNNCSAIQMLVQHERVNVNCLNSLKETPLITAIKRRYPLRQSPCQLEVIGSLLLSPNLDVNYNDPDGHTAIWHAIESDEEEAVRMLLQQKNVDFNAVDQSGKTPLACAAENGSLSMVKLLLLQPGIHANAQTADTQPAFWLACRAGQYSVVEYLIRQKMIDINQKGLTGTSPLQVAIIMDHLSVVELLLSQEDRISVNDQGPQAWTALTFASASGKDGMVRYLMDHPHIDVNVTDNHKRTPFWWAAAGGHLTVVRLLRQHPLLKQRWKDCNGKTAYAIAKDNGHGHIKVVLRAF